MLSALIGNARAAAQSVLNTPNIPPQARSVQDHAANFNNSMAPMLVTFAQQSLGFADNVSRESTGLLREVQLWKGGDARARDRIMAVLQRLQSSLNTLMQSDQNAFTTLSRFRDLVLGDQRVIAQTANDLNNQQSVLQSQMRDAREHLSGIQSRISWLRYIPFAWAVAEIANLIATSKTIEQTISDAQNRVYQIAHQMANLGQAQAAVQSFSGQLQTLEGSVQNIINGIGLTHGQLMQIVDAVQSGQQGAIPVVLEAYLGTLKGQADNLANYLRN